MNCLKFKVEHVAAALQKTGGNVTAAAKILKAAYGKCDPSTVRVYLHRHPELAIARTELRGDVLTATRATDELAWLRSKEGERWLATAPLSLIDRAMPASRR
jgi:hypothetical protein